MSIRRKQSALDEEIERVIRGLMSHQIGSEGYRNTMELIAQLQMLDRREKSKPLSKDTMAIVSANLLGILMIIKHERVNVITSKALNFVMRP